MYFCDITSDLGFKCIQLLQLVVKKSGCNQSANTCSRSSCCSINFFNLPAKSAFSSRSLTFFSWLSVICIWMSAMVVCRKRGAEEKEKNKCCAHLCTNKQSKLTYVKMNSHAPVHTFKHPLYHYAILWCSYSHVLQSEVELTWNLAEISRLFSSSSLALCTLSSWRQKRIRPAYWGHEINNNQTPLFHQDYFIFVKHISPTIK